MNEKDLQQMVARARDAEGAPSAPPPGLAAEARTTSRHRRRVLTLGAGALVAAVIMAGVAVPRLVGSSDDDPVPAVDRGELAAHGGPCPSVLPTATDDEGYGFGTTTPADGDPRFAAPEKAWVCQYGSRDVAPIGHSGALYEWVLNGSPRRLDDDLLSEISAAMNEITPVEPTGCDADLGPRYLLVTSSGGDLTGVSVDAYGCRDVRLTDDPFVTAPGDPQEGGTVPGVLTSPGLMETLTTWWETSPADDEHSPVPTELRVTCTGAGPQVGSNTVAARAQGVVVAVDSTMPTGSYFTYESDGLSGGDDLKQIPRPTIYTFPPGTLTIDCRKPGMDEIAPVEIEIVDPDGYWRTSTIADFGCQRGAQPSWAVGNGTGATPKEAVDALLDQFGDGAGRDRDDWTAEPAPTGYSGSETQTWIGYRRGTPYASIQVTRAGTSYVANPDVLCGKLE